jgi:excinuclease UvrABC nuclease subunit
MSINKIRVNWSKPLPFVLDNAASVPEKGGVYEILEPIKEGEKSYLHRRYVGQTDNLRKRFQDHLNEAEPNKCIKKLAANKITKFDYALLEKQDDRMDTERALYDKYKSQLSCNDTSPAGSGRRLLADIEEINPQ